MNPGIFLLGGGGGAGGSGAGGGKGGAGKQGANGKNGGKDANGGGKGAGNCGAGSGAGRCPTHSAKTGAGDPVDPVTGAVFTSPEADLWLPGLIPIEFLRSYRSSDDPRDIGMGFGWSHSFAWSIEEHRRHCVVTTDDSTRVLMDKPDVAERSIGREGWVLRRELSSYELDAGDDLTRVFTPHPTDEGQFVLSTIRDRNDNQIELKYDRGLLVEVVDTVGRVIRLRRSQSSGRIAAVEVKNAAAQARWIAFASYSYDDRGDLVCVTDADGVAVYFTYDDDHLITSTRHADGLTFHWLYDAQRRCVETWGDHPDPAQLALASDVPDVLADGSTKARGILHVRLEYFPDGYTEVTDSIRVRRIAGNEFGSADKHDDGGRIITWDYDDYGNPVRNVDPLGGVTIWKRDEIGRLNEKTDPAGRTYAFRRDERGDIVEVVLPDGSAIVVGHNAAGNVTSKTDPLGRTTRFVRAPNGRVLERIEPTGLKWTYRYDAYWNLAELVDPAGNSYRWEHDELGRTTAYSNPEGGTWRFYYTDLGRLHGKVLPTGGQYRFSFDACGRRNQVVDPEGRVSRAEWAHLSKIRRTFEPDGRHRTFAFNREGWETEIKNAKGELHTVEYDSFGNMVAERTFDGRLLQYKRDTMGNVLRFDAGNGEWVEVTYDAVGAIVAQAFDDGTQETFEYDACGRLVRVASNAVEIAYDRDAAGRLLREHVTFDGRTHTIDRKWDDGDELVRRSTSLGHVAELKRDPAGSIVESLLDGERITHVRDRIGRERRRVLPGSGEIDFEYGSGSKLTRYLARGPGGAAGGRPSDPGEPVWLGQRGPAPVIDRTFELSPRNRLLRSIDQKLGVSDISYDAAGRLVGRMSPTLGIREEYGYDETNNVFEANQGLRTHGPGDRLLRHGNTELDWDSAGRLIERREKVGDDVRVTRYEWGTKGYLRSVTLPDGRKVEFDYDPFMRRVAKRVYRRDEAGKLQLLEKVGFVWDKEHLLHELRERAAAAGDPIVQERTYHFSEEAQIPLAHKDVRKADGTAGDWYHYVNDPAGTPDFLLGADGHVAWGRTHDVWGKTESEGPTETTTPLRFRGQYEDAETGLAYNRNRYYDPTLGRYISADPIDLAGDFNVYGYGTDPANFPDIYGLEMHTATAVILGPDGKPKRDLGSFNSTQDGDFDQVVADPSHRWKDKVQSDKYKKNEGNYQSGLDSMLSHTEKKICTKAKQPPSIGKGDTLQIKGKLPPCSTCKAFMKDLAKDKECNVEYHFDGPDSPWRHP